MIIPVKSFELALNSLHLYRQKWRGGKAGPQQYNSNHVLTHNIYCIVYVQMTLSRVIVEMVVDGGGYFSPASYRWFTHLSLLFSSYTAHSRAAGNPIEHLYTPIVTH